MKINFLTKGFNNWYGQTFLFPLNRYKSDLKKRGIDLNWHRKETPALTDCDLLIVDNTWFRDEWELHSEKVLEKLANYRASVGRLHYFDFMDSSGMPHVRALPYVDRYWKSYLLKDRLQYLKPWYGHRLYTDYYYNHSHIIDSNPSRSEPIEDVALLKKLGVGWSSALANYSYLGLYQIELFKRFRIKKILSMVPRSHHPTSIRNHDLFCRIGCQYSRETLAHQRLAISKLLRDRIPINRVSRRQYFKELSNSRLAISPFGYGEVCYRDYEAFLSGTILIKPDMTHMETWPNLYKDKETVLYHHWDLSDFESLIDNTLTHYHEAKTIAENAQSNYKKYLLGKAASERFCQHFLNMMKEGDDS